jgi:chromosome segregation ATPase
MSTTNQAAEFIEQFAQHFEHLSEAVVVLKKIGSLENHLSELAIARDKELGAIEDLKSAVKVEEEGVASAKERHAETIVALQKEALGLRASYENQAAQTIEKAKADASALIESAQQAIASLKAEHEKKMASTHAELEALEERVASFTKQIDQLAVEAEEIRREKDAEQDGLDRVRAVIDELAKK